MTASTKVPWSLRLALPGSEFPSLWTEQEASTKSLLPKGR